MRRGIAIIPLLLLIFYGVAQASATFYLNDPNFAWTTVGTVYIVSPATCDTYVVISGVLYGFTNFGITGASLGTFGFSCETLGGVANITGATATTLSYVAVSPETVKIWSPTRGQPTGVTGGVGVWDPFLGVTNIVSGAGVVTLTWAALSSTLVNATTISTYLAAGDYIGLAFAPYTLLLGDMLGGVFMLAIMMPLYNRTQSLDYCLVVWVLLSAALTVALPASTFRLSYIFLVLGVTALLYRLIVPRG